MCLVKCELLDNRHGNGRIVDKSKYWDQNRLVNVDKFIADIRAD